MHENKHGRQGSAVILKWGTKIRPEVDELYMNSTRFDLYEIDVLPVKAEPDLGCGNGRGGRIGHSRLVKDANLPIELQEQMGLVAGVPD